MKRTPIIVVLILVAAILACGAPTNPSQPSNVETIVAGTFEALTAPADVLTPASSTESTSLPPTSSLLPFSLYYLNNDSAGIKQVFRIEKDGVTIKQVTFEPADVNDYDPSRVDGSVVYVSNNQLLLVKADGSDRRVLVDGGAVDENNPYLANIVSPVWSPDNQTIAYGHKGLNFYSVATGNSNLVIENDWRDAGGGLMVPRELFWPDQYSPDGSKLLITLGYYEGSSSAIYYPDSEGLVRLNGDASRDICCDLEWTQDGAALYSGRATIGMFGPGLWKIDAATGMVSTLLAGDAGNGTFNFSSYPFLSPNGKLYFFFTNQPASDEFVSRVKVQLVRSAPDGVTDRALLRPETFETMNEALWSPDASFVIVAFAPIEDVYYGGRAEIVYIDPQKANVPLVDFAMNMKWGE